MHSVNLILAIIGGSVILIAAASNVIKSRTPFSEPLIALTCGTLVGPAFLNLLDPNDWSEDVSQIVQEVARFVLAVGLMDVAIRLPQNYFQKHWRSVMSMLMIVMPLMWLVSGAIIYLVLDVTLEMAMLLGAIVTPTDPIVAAAIVTGRFAQSNLPGHLRHLLSAESGSNDGLGFPFVWLALLLIRHAPASEWFAQVLLWEVGGAMIIGGMLGFVAAQLLRWGKSEQIDRSELLIYSLALSFTILGITRLLVTEGILAVFIGGLVFKNTLHDSELLHEEADIQEAIGLTFTLAFFALLGMLLPWSRWSDLGWQAIMLVGLILLLRRLPALLLLHKWLLPQHQTKDALFLGWFGPIGVAALFYALMAYHETNNELIWTVTSLIVTVSILVHGATSTVGIKRYRQTH